MRSIMLRINLSGDDLFPYIMIAPVAFVILGLTIYPIITGLKLSLYDYTLIAPAKPFIGLGNYAELFRDARFYRILSNTIWFTILSVAASTIMGVGAALLLNQKFKGVGIVRSITLLPWVTPAVILAFVWVWIFSKSFSPVNDLLMRLGLLKEPLSFLGDMSWRIGPITLPAVSVLIVRTWTSFPFKAIMFLAALQSIPVDLYEAAAIDGATSWHKFRFVTLPALIPVGAVVVTLSTIWNISHFNYNYLMTKGGPFDATNVIAVFLYQTGFAVYRLGYAAAVGGAVLLMTSVLGGIYIYMVSRQERI